MCLNFYYELRTINYVLLEEFLQDIRIQRILICILHRYLAPTDQLCKRAIHVYHALTRAGFYNCVYFVRALFADEV